MPDQTEYRTFVFGKDDYLIDETLFKVLFQPEPWFSTGGSMTTADQVAAGASPNQSGGDAAEAMCAKALTAESPAAQPSWIDNGADNFDTDSQW